MPITVPTIDEFNTLTDRVTKLEQGQPTPPNPDPGPDTGMLARRIADVVESFGVNTFSSMDEHNVWGSWPADYRPESVIAALNYMTEDTGFRFRLREYHYAGRIDMQRRWLTTIVAALPGTKVAICPGANASAADVPSMISLANDPACGICWVEGLNEPNTDFGSGEVPLDQTKAIQDAVWTAREGRTILGPSIVAGTPHPEGWIRGYCGDQLAAISAAMHHANGHYYPPGCPDVPNTGYSTLEYVEGVGIGYSTTNIDLTEYHPTLYNSQGNKPDQPGWNGDRDAYYTLLTLLRCAQCGVFGLWWYALFDYGQSYICGLFPKSGTDAPRPSATALRNFCRIVSDPFAEARTFTPGRLDVAIDGLSAACDWDLFQASDGRFFVALWNAARDLGGSAIPVSLILNGAVASVAEYDPLSSDACLNTASGVSQYDLVLPPGVRIVAVEK